jgi:hypothetical protein
MSVSCLHACVDGVKTRHGHLDTVSLACVREGSMLRTSKKGEHWNEAIVAIEIDAESIHVCMHACVRACVRACVKGVC